MKIKLFFAWCDFWIGFFYDRKKHTLYFCPLPAVVLKIELTCPDRYVVQIHKDIPEVSLIAKVDSSGMYSYNIYTTNQTYDDILMERLIDYEMLVMEKYSKLLISISHYTYDPKINIRCISGNEKILFER
jgi:hypothetical protein